jgi:hypothetical protein
MLTPIIRIETLRGVGDIQAEVINFRRLTWSIGRFASSMAPMRTALTGTLKGARRGKLRSAAEAFWLTLIAALAAWAVSPGENPLRGSTGSSPGCLFGKGGVICNGSASAAQKMTTENADPCLNLGKGGRYCAPAK